jgi:DNA-binding transcriptional regulator YiaG
LTRNTDPATLVREVRTRLGLTQEKFAARLGVTLPTINRWENGRTKPSPLAVRTLRDLVAGMGDEGKDLMAGFLSDWEK